MFKIFGEYSNNRLNAVEIFTISEEFHDTVSYNSSTITLKFVSKISLLKSLQNSHKIIFDHKRD